MSSKNDVPVIQSLESRVFLHAGHALTEVFIDAGAKKPSTDASGDYWYSDVNFKQGKTGTKPFKVDGTNDDRVYSSYRHGKKFSYSLELPDGPYTLKLY